MVENNDSLKKTIGSTRSPDNLKSAASKESGWGIENVPYPKGLAHIKPRYDLCVGCGICEMECSMYHFGVINRKLSRIKIHKYLLPLPKSVQTVCAQCQPKQERKCENACPLYPPAIYFEEKNLHMTVDEDRCLGSKCRKCAEACAADVIHFDSTKHNSALVCDLCATQGERKPRCVDVCPAYALEYMPAFSVTPPTVQTPPYAIGSPSYYRRIHPDEIAELWAKRLRPLPKDKVGPW